MQRAVLLSSALLFASSHAAAQQAATSHHFDRPPSQPSSPAYTANKAPLQPGALIKLPIASFKPRGWLHKALDLQREGLAGRLGEISIWLTRDGNAWLNTDGKGQYGWEEVPYWLRGYARIAYTLNDRAMLDETKVWIDGALASQRENGDFGPIQLRNNKRDLWAQMLMLQVLQSHHEFTGDPRVLPFMSRYFTWQNTIPDDQFLEDYWEKSRGGDNLASVYWLYNRTGESFLLDLATKIDRNTANWRQENNLPNWHVVNIAECFRAPATYFLQSGKQSDLEASYRNFALIRERFGQVPGGMFGADENARPGYTDPHQAAETCSFVEQIASNLVMTEITADPAWAANTEDVAFNSMPAAFMPDYSALRYLTAPNQVCSDAQNHAPGIANAGPFMLMNPFSSRCCQHNHSSAWVNLAEHAWLATHDAGLAAISYVSGDLTAKTAAGPITLSIDTNYPFDDLITIRVHEGAGHFPLYLRIPSWTRDASITINGTTTSPAPKPGTYTQLLHTWKTGDTITLKLPMHVSLRRWERNQNAVSVDYGPLTFSLKIDETYSRIASDKAAQHDSGWQPTADPSKWPSYEIMPASRWNYGLLIDERDPSASFEVVKRDWPASNTPWTNAAAPLILRAKGKLIPGWTIDRHGLAGALPLSPIQSAEPTENLTLVPMGGARLRISSFPVVK